MPTSWEEKKRTHHLNELTLDQVGQKVVLMGWAGRRRDHGGVIFVDLRDREGDHPGGLRSLPR